MPAKLKDFFDGDVVRDIARRLHCVYPSFDEASFVRACLARLEQLELTARGWHVADALERYLPQPFEEAARVLVQSLEPELQSSESFALGPLRYMPHVFFVAKYGLEHFEASMAAQYELTKRFSAEFSIRAFLVRYPEPTYRRLREWAADPNVHVRRLVSEGTRPRLPWAPRLRNFQEDPRPVLELLELLKDDSERYVQRSVANNLNDIGKDHPELATSVCQRWSRDAPANRRWIVKHALRSLVKRGDRAALATLGFSAAPKVAIANVHVPDAVALGSELRFSFALVSTSRRRQELLVDYAVHFVKKRGASRPKVFKLEQLSLEPEGHVELGGRVSFAEMTTRRHHPGEHRVDLLINGVVHPLASFQCVAEPELRSSRAGVRGRKPRASRRNTR